MELKLIRGLNGAQEVLSRVDPRTFFFFAPACPAAASTAMLRLPLRLCFMRRILLCAEFSFPGQGERLVRPGVIGLTAGGHAQVAQNVNLRAI